MVFFLACKEYISSIGNPHFKDWSHRVPFIWWKINKIQVGSKRMKEEEDAQKNWSVG